MKTRDRIVKQLLDRDKMWKDMYSLSYYEKFFHLYDDERNAVLEYIREAESKKDPAINNGEGI